MWSRQIAEDVDVSVPLYPDEHFYILTEPIENLDKNLSKNHLLLHVSERNGHQRVDLGGLTIDSVHTLEASETPQTRCLIF